MIYPERGSPKDVPTRLTALPDPTAQTTLTGADTVSSAANP